jgi:hypothetical protein
MYSNAKKNMSILAKETQNGITHVTKPPFPRGKCIGER